MSDTSSSSPERELTPPLNKINKGKKKSIPSDGKGKNEGPDPNWDYKPPAGVTRLQCATDAGEFDWDAVANDEDTELWLIRVPESIKPKYLENTTLKALRSVKKSSRMAQMIRKHATFDIWSMGEEDDVDIGGEEIKALSCLLPRKSKKGKLYPAPKPIARHLVVSAQAVVPTPDPTSTGPIQAYSRPPRENYPKEVLTHTFHPYGSLGSSKVEEENNMDVDVPSSHLQPSPKQKKAKRIKTEPMGDVKDEEENKMDIDMTLSQPVPPPSPTQKKAKRAKVESSEEEKKVKGKKRKGEGEEVSSGKKPKKVKTS